ncbi:peptidoglycan glycosyltransferase [Alicyclobacillus cycloheptanicus]|nr:peptidoglycan glycosyltransferase [Alicyclobacillus cycloheptanicus]
MSYRSEDHPQTSDHRRRTYIFRVNVVSFSVFFALSSLIFRLGYLQITKGAQLKTQALTTSVQYIPVLPARGRIYDANGNLLAYDQPTYSVYLTRVQHVNDDTATLSKMAALLAPVFHKTTAQVLQLMKADKQYTTVTLFKNITTDQLSFISEHQAQLPGVNVEVDSERKYPYGDLAGQVLGYVGPITPQNKKYYVDEQHYLLMQQVGAAGLELQYENQLKGKVGYQEEQYNTVNNGVKPVGYIPPVSGNNLQLTLDGALEADTQNAVLKAIQSFESENHTQVQDAAAVMIDVKTGGILAMVSYPYLDPNWFVNGDFTLHTNYLQNGAEMNNVIQNPHAPGSTVKPANLITGLEHGAVTPNTVYDDSGVWQWIGNYHMHEDASYGLVDDVTAIAVSDDRFFYTLGLNLGGWLGSSPYDGGYPRGGNLQRWRDTDFIKGLLMLMQGEMRFGLGQITGIDLPGEQAGAFYMENQSNNTMVTMSAKDVQSIAQTVAKQGSYTNYGSPYDLAAMAFGQSQQFTPIELLQYVSTLADNGKKLQPHLLQAVYPPGLTQNLSTANEKPLQTVAPNVQATVNINPTYLKLAQEGMYAACNTPQGTAYPSFGNAPYKAAGKTGTAEITMGSKSINNSVFIGYAPYNNPQIAVAVMVPGAGYGAVTAVPIARQMMDFYFEEHHANFMPKSTWVPTTIPANWTQSPAYKLPEQSN